MHVQDHSSQGGTSTISRKGIVVTSRKHHAEYLKRAEAASRKTPRHSQPLNFESIQKRKEVKWHAMQKVLLEWR